MRSLDSLLMEVRPCAARPTGYMEACPAVSAGAMSAAMIGSFGQLPSDQGYFLITVSMGRVSDSAANLVTAPKEAGRSKGKAARYFQWEP